MGCKLVKSNYAVDIFVEIFVGLLGHPGVDKLGTW
jgi:hypothetical protein